MQCTMAGENMPIDVTNTLTDLTTGNDIEITPEPVIKQCPLCQSAIRLFFVNFNEKMLMCENTECEFPFGHEELQFVTYDSSATDDENATSRTGYSKKTSSLGSSAIWSDIDKIQNAFDDENIQNTPKETSSKEKMQKKKESQDKLQKNIDDIRELSEELNSLNSVYPKTERRIKNERWIKNLKNFQQISGVQLLRPEEICLLKKEEPCLGRRELKIDIDRSNKDSISSITIEIHDNNKKKT